MPQKIVGKHKYSVSASVKIGFWPSPGAMQSISVLGSFVFSVSNVFIQGALDVSSVLESSSEDEFNLCNSIFSFFVLVFLLLLLLNNFNHS